MRRARPFAGVAAFSTAVLLLGIAPATAATTLSAATPTPPPAATALARTRGPHVMPMRPPSGTVRSAAVAAAAPPAGAHLSYYGGRVVANTEVVEVLWGAGTAGTSNGQYLSQVLNTSSPSVATFYQGVLNSSYVDWLSEYTTPTQGIGRGSFAGQYTITPSSGASTISDATIQSELTTQILAGHLPVPHQDAAGNTNTYYAIFFPHGKQITMGGTSSCVSGGFVAYHGTIANVGGHEIYYGVHPDLQAGSGCQGQGQTGSVFGDVTAVASHELVETMTDPEVGIAPAVGAPLAWYDATNGEIGDICNATPGSTTGSDGLTYFVQKQWSNAQGICTVGAPANDFSLAATPVTVLAGSSGTSTVSSAVVTGTAESVALSVTGLPTGVTASFSPTTVTAGGSSTLTLAAGAAVAAGTYSMTVKGTAPSVIRSATAVLTVTRAAAVTSAASTTFTTGTSGTFTVTSTGVPTPSLSATGALPSGITFVDKGNGTATLSGAPATRTGGSYPLILTAHNGAAPDATQSFTLVVHEAAALTSAGSASFGVGTSGTFSVTATGYPIPALTETGALPSGVALVDNGNASATLSGTPAGGSEGVYTVTLKATNGVGVAATQSFTLTVTGQDAITSAASTTFLVGSAGMFTVTTAGVPSASITESGALPSGVAFVDNGNGSGTLSGTPAAGQSGSFPVTFTAHNGVGTDAVQSFVLTVHQPAAFTSASSTTFVVGSAGTFGVMSTGDPVPVLSESGALPSGVTFVDNGNGSGTLAGTPGSDAVASYALTITAHNGVGAVAQQSFVLHIDRPSSVTSAASTTFVVGTAGSFNVTSHGAPAPSLSHVGTLPKGVTFTDNGNGTATISGTPAASTGGSYPIAITASNGVGADATQQFTIVVDESVTIAETASVFATIGDGASMTVRAVGVPLPALSTSSVLPSGLSLIDHGDGSATLSGVPLPGSAGIYPVVVTASNGIGSSVAETTTVVVSRRATTLHYDGPTTGRYASAVTLSATLLDTETGTPVGSRTVHLVVGSQHVDAASTWTTGTASGSVTLTQPSGTVGLAAGFDGDTTYASASAAVRTGFTVTRRTAVVSTGPGYLRQLTAVRGTAAAFTVRAAVRRPLDASTRDLGSIPWMQVRLVPIARGSARTCIAAPTSLTSRMTRTASGDWSVACRFPSGLPVGVYEVVVTVGSNAYWSGSTTDVLLVSPPAVAGAHGAGVLTGAGLPARSSVAFAFLATRVGRGGGSVMGRVVSVLSVTDPATGVVTQHVLTSRTMTGMLVRAARAPFTAALSGTGRWDSSASVRFALTVRDTTGGVRDRDWYGQVISAPTAGSAVVVILQRLRPVVVGSGDIAVR